MNNGSVAVVWEKTRWRRGRPYSHRGGHATWEIIRIGREARKILLCCLVCQDRKEEAVGITAPSLTTLVCVRASNHNWLVSLAVEEVDENPISSWPYYVVVSMLGTSECVENPFSNFSSSVHGPVCLRFTARFININSSCNGGTDIFSDLQHHSFIPHACQQDASLSYDSKQIAQRFWYTVQTACNDHLTSYTVYYILIKLQRTYRITDLLSPIMIEVKYR